VPVGRLPPKQRADASVVRDFERGAVLERFIRSFPELRAFAGGEKTTIGDDGYTGKE
jgi:hypothetical protein